MVGFSPVASRHNSFQSLLVLVLLVIALFTLIVPACADITSGLVGCWKMDEGSGTVAVDSSSYHNDGTLQNVSAPATATSGWTKGRQGGALKFDGTNDYISFAAISLGTEHSVSMWVKPEGQVNAYNYGGLVGDGSSTTAPLAVGGVAADTYSYNMLTGGVGASTPSMVGSWHMLTSVRSGTSVNLYYDGQLLVSGTLPANIAATPNRIGHRSDSFFYKGDIDSVHIYSRALTAADVKELYLQGCARIGGAHIANAHIGH